jgi:hypothetical protein
MNEKIGIDEIFETGWEAEIVIWHLLNLLGGKVTIPDDPEFWNTAVEPDTEHRIVLRKEDGKMVLVAEKLGWS